MEEVIRHFHGILDIDKSEINKYKQIHLRHFHEKVKSDFVRFITCFFNQINILIFVVFNNFLAVPPF